MKNWITKVVSLVLATALFAVVSMPAYAVNNVKKEPLTPTANTTWGDVIRYFDPQGYEELPDDIRRQLNASMLNLGESAEPGISEQNEIDDEDDVQEVTTAGVLTPKVREVNLSGVLLTLKVGAKKEALTYNAELSAGLTCPYMYVSAILYDAETNKVVDTDSTAKSNTKSCQLEGTFEDLKSKHEYTIVSNGILTPPAGYAFSGIQPGEITKKTK